MGEVHDKAEYHFESCDERELDHHQAHVHTGFYVGWLVRNKLLAKKWSKKIANGVQAFLAGDFTGPELYAGWGGELTDKMLSDEGKAFTASYFDFDDGKFLDDYQELLACAVESEFHVADSWENFEKLAARIDARFAQWRSKQKQ